MGLLDRARQLRQEMREAAKDAPAPPRDTRDRDTINFEDIAIPAAETVAQAWFELMEVEPVALRAEYFQRYIYEPVAGSASGDYYHHLHGYFEIEGQLFRVNLELTCNRVPKMAENSTRHKPKYKADVEMCVRERVDAEGSPDRAWEVVRSLADIGYALEYKERIREFECNQAKQNGDS